MKSGDQDAQNPAVLPGRPKPRWLTQALLGLACLVFVAALWVRAQAPRASTRPEDQPQSGPSIVEPMQFLSRGARLRAEELEAHLGTGVKAEFRAMRRAVFALQGCPRSIDWLDGAEGQRFERLLATLRMGTAAEAFAAVVLSFQLARATEWTPGLRGQPQSAERLGGILQDWLRVWGERSVRDPLLSEPGLAVALLYGRVMRTAWRAPIVGYEEAPYLRARQFLRQWCGERGSRTAFGQALELRYARALHKLGENQDALLGFEEECQLLFPTLDGKCSDE